MTAKLNRRGAIAALTAVVMIPVVGFAGLAIDLTRIWMVSARLKTSVDAASLIAARTLRTTTVNAVRTTTPDTVATQALFWANFNQNGAWPNFLGSSVITSTPAQPVIEPVAGSETRVRVTATATLNTTLFGVISRQTTTLRETTVAERGGTGLELAIAIDQTSSMSAASGMGGTKLEAAQDAVDTLLTQIFGAGNDTARNVFVSVVPFARTFNFGTSYANVLDTSAVPSEWDVNNWTGCVEARRGGEDITDIAPTTTRGQFRPYFYPNTYRRVGWASVNASGSGSNAIPASPSNAVVNGGDARNATIWRTLTGEAPYDGAGACTYSTSANGNGNNAYNAVTVNLYASSSANATSPYTLRFCRGDNDFGNPSLATATGNWNYNPMYAALRSAGLSGIGYTATSAAGPNMLCAMSPLLPLTASRAAVMAHVRAIQAPTRSGGTTAVTGMQGAWYTLSPNWSGSWRNLPTSPDYGALPLAYATRNMVKAVVILTDGDNNWQCLYGNSQNASSACATSPVRAAPPGGGPRSSSGTPVSTTGVEMLYNAYGRTFDWNENFGSTQDFTAAPTQTRADALLDGRFAAICDAMKRDRVTNVLSTNPAEHSIQIYVVGFEIRNPTAGNANTVVSMLQTCASSASRPYFIEVTQASDLDGAFSEIGTSLSSLRMIE